MQAIERKVENDESLNSARQQLVQDAVKHLSEWFHTEEGQKTREFIRTQLKGLFSLASESAGMDCDEGYGICPDGVCRWGDGVWVSPPTSIEEVVRAVLGADDDWRKRIGPGLKAEEVEPFVIFKEGTADELTKFICARCNAYMAKPGLITQPFTKMASLKLEPMTPLPQQVDALSGSLFSGEL